MTDASAALDRFLAAQSGVIDQAIAELTAGAKTSHWMWYVFPQLAGLGHSAMARAYAIADRAEAQAYLAHPLLRARLDAATGAMLGWAGKRSAETILGEIDAVKLRSSMTLFEVAAEASSPLYAAVLDAFYDAMRDPATLGRLEGK